MDSIHFLGAQNALPRRHACGLQRAAENDLVKRIVRFRAHPTQIRRARTRLIHMASTTVRGEERCALLDGVR